MAACVVHAAAALPVAERQRENFELPWQRGGGIYEPLRPPPPPPPPTLRGQGRANDRNVGVVRMTGRPGEALFPASIFRVSSQYLLGIFRMSSFFRVFSSI